MNNLVENLITTLILVALALTAWFMAQDSDRLGDTIPTPVAFFETSLQSSITSSDTSMTLVDFETADGTNLATGTTYGFVVDEGSSNQEIVLGTASTSNKIVSMTRGVSAVTGRTSVSDLKSSHRRGASVKITDAPVLLTLARILNGDDTVPNPMKYASGVSTTTIGNNNSYLATAAYVDSVSYSGTSDADTDTKGIVEQGTTSELASGVSSGDTSAPLFAPLQFFNTSASATTVPVTDNSGKLAQGWLDLTEAFTFSGDNTYSGTSTFSKHPQIPTTTPANDEATSKHYVDNQDSGFLWKTLVGNNFSSATTISSNYKLTEDKYYTDLTVNNGVRLDTNGFRIFIENTFTNNGTTSNNATDTPGTSQVAVGTNGTLGGGQQGSPGNDSKGGAGGNGGGIVFIFADTIDNTSGVIEAHGGDGGDGSGSASTQNGGSDATDLSCGKGGDGGDSGDAGDRGGGAGATVSDIVSIKNLLIGVNGDCPGQEIPIKGGGGGAQGAYDDSNRTAGGGGGGGGSLWLYYDTSATWGTEQAFGGAGGSGVGASDGSSGATGTVYKVQF